MREQVVRSVSGTTDNLPYSLEFEKSVLGSVLIDNDSLIKIADSLSPDDFYDAQNRMIYQAMLDLYGDLKPIDILTLSNQLKANGNLDQVGGASYLSELTNFVPTASRVETYANVVSEKALRRRLNHVNKELAGLMIDETKNLDELIEEAESQIFTLSQRHIKDSITSIEDILGNSFERLDELHNNKDKIRGIPTGYKDLDNMLAGLNRSDLIILAARPAMGKTAFVLNLAHKVATLAKEPVLIFSLEMSKEQLVDRILSMESGVDGWALRTGNLTDDDFERLSHAMGTLGEAPIYIDDTPSISINELRTKAKREAHKHPLGLIIVDYLQLMSGGPKFAGTANRVQEISEISRGLKAIARELNVPLISLSQLSRSVESRSPQIPQLADLRESGSIEQDADIVAFLYREEYYNPETENKKNILEVLIKKHRHGAVGNVDLYFDRDKQRIRSIDSKHSHPFEG
jgi:replicative DNA helicase